MSTQKGSSTITRRAALSALLAGSAAALLPRRLEAALRPDSPPRYELTDLGTLPGQTSSGANVINNRGQIGGWVSNGGQNFPGLMATQPVLWTDGKMRILNAPDTPVFIYRNGKQQQLPDSYPFTEALKFASVVAVNERGDGLVCAQLRGYEGNAPRRVAASWQPPESTYFWSAENQRLNFVYDVTTDRLFDDGSIIIRGFDVLWQQGNEKQIVPNPWSIYPAKSARATRWRNVSSEQPRDIRGVYDFPNVVPFVRNNKGQIAGQVWREMAPKPGEDYQEHNMIPVLWEANGTPKILDQARVERGFAPIGMNSHGDIAGAFRLNAYLYTKGKLFDLNSLISPEIAREWKLTEARDINDQGQIVGNAKKGGYTRAFLLTPTATPR